MQKLIRLEIRRNCIRGYLKAVFIITITMLGVLYLFAAIPYIEDSATDIEMFMTYNGIVPFVCVISMACFSILSSVMYNKFIIEEYTSKKAFLLFSYPIKRTQILWAKVLTVFLFTVISMALSGIAIFILFYITESIIPICKDTLTLAIMSGTLFCIMGYSLMAASVAVVSLWFGFWKKSASATIVSEIIVITAFGNFFAMGIFNAMFVMGGVVISILTALILNLSIAHKINTMELD